MGEKVFAFRPGWTLLDKAGNTRQVNLAIKAVKSGLSAMSESEKPKLDPNATTKIDALGDLQDPPRPAWVVGDPESSSEMTMVRVPPGEGPGPPEGGSIAPRPSHAPRAPRAEVGAAFRGVPKLGLEIDDQDSNTTVMFNALDTDPLHALKRRLQADLDGEDIDANRTLEFQAIRAVQLEELERLLNSDSKIGQQDPNKTMQLDVVDDGALEELEASLESEKRTRDVRKMSHAVHGDARAPQDASSGPRGSPGTDDEEIMLALARDVAAAWAVVAAAVRRLVARVRTELRPPPASTRRVISSSSDDTIPPTSAGGRRRRRARWFETK